MYSGYVLNYLLQCLVGARVCACGYTGVNEENVHYTAIYTIDTVTNQREKKNKNYSLRTTTVYCSKCMSLMLATASDFGAKENAQKSRLLCHGYVHKKTEGNDSVKSCYDPYDCYSWCPLSLGMFLSDAPIRTRAFELYDHVNGSLLCNVFSYRRQYKKWGRISSFFLRCG